MYFIVFFFVKKFSIAAAKDDFNKQPYRPVVHPTKRRLQKKDRRLIVIHTAVSREPWKCGLSSIRAPMVYQATDPFYCDGT